MLLLQASPILGILLGGFDWDWRVFSRIALLLIGSIALTAQVFIFNDWAGHVSDASDPRRAAQSFAHRAEVAYLAIALLAVSMAALALVSVSAILFGIGIAGLSVLYSAARPFGKGKPILASVLHVVGGGFHFLLGYTVSHSIDSGGLAIALFFGLVFAGGHLNQEVRDYEADRCNGIRTTAVVFGRRRAFVASLVIFTAAYALLILLVTRAVLAPLLIWAGLLWPWHLYCSLRTLRGDVGFDAAIWMQRRYRLQFALLGLVMAFTTPPVMDLARHAHRHTSDYIRHSAPARRAPSG